MPGTRIPPNGLTKKCSSEHRRGRGTLPRQSRKATPGRAAQAARRSVSEMSQTSKQRIRPAKACQSPRTRTRLNGLTRKCSSEHRPGPGFRTAKSKRPLRAQGSGDMPRIKSPHQRTGAVAGLCPGEVGKRLECRRGLGRSPNQKKGRLLETSLIPNTKLLTANTQDNLSQVPLIAIEPRNTKTNYHNDNVRQGLNCQKV